MRGTARPGRHHTGVTITEMTAPRSTRSLAVVVLAAGRGKRLKSARPKVLHELCGRAILWHVLRAVRGARPGRIVIVVSDAGGPVEDAVRSWAVSPEPTVVEQNKRLGAGHAVSAARQAGGRVAATST